MIARLNGSLLLREPTRLIVDAAGIGFELFVPLSTSRVIPEPGTQISLLVVLEISRSGVQLFGFATEKEKDVFQRLRAVPGVGPKAALNLLSRFEPEEILRAIARNDARFLKSAPGIGPKKAESILKKLNSELAEKPAAGVSDLLETAVTALVSLGLSRKEAEQRLKKVKVSSDITIQELLRQALAQSGTGAVETGSH